MTEAIVGRPLRLVNENGKLDLRTASIDAVGDEDLAIAIWVLRSFEEKSLELRLSGAIVGSVHLGIGQEAIPAGALLALVPGDPVYSTYRGHGWALACGADPEALFAEILGRRGGVNGGRGGSAYFSVPAEGFYGENSIVGAGAPIACGAALAAKFDQNGSVALSVFGDGAMNQGSVSEAFNFASVMKLPVVFVCENNRYSELTPIAGMVANPNLFERGLVYGMPSVRVDGNDARAVADAVGTAAANARAGMGPSLIEAVTQRLVGHYIGDAELYRAKGELELAVEDEPLARLRRALLASGRPASELDRSRDDAVARIAAASERALAQPLADPTTVYSHLYSDEAYRD
jgi:pyruvate dehydrogenase E1 component alpha subunit